MLVSGLSRSLFLSGDGPPGSFSGSRIGLGSLSPHGKSTNVALATVASDIHKALDIGLDLTAEISLDLVVVLDDRRNLAYLLLGEVSDPGIAANPNRREDTPRAGKPDPMDMRQRVFQAFLRRDIDACNSGHWSNLTSP